MAPAAAPPERWRAASPTQLIVTSGELRPLDPTRFGLDAPTFRAELGAEPRDAVEAEFVYLGPTRDTARLTSGELRRQIGLKLRAQNTCNVVYVMWHIEPAPRLAVSVKANPGQRRHAECSDRGYSFLEPERSRPVGVVREGERHVLRAAIEGSTLRVFIDGVESWAGPLPSAAFEFDGPVGLRADNARFEVELRAPAVL